MRLALASMFTLGLLFAFLLSILAGISYFVGIIDVYFLLAFVLVINFLTWLLGPYVQDIVLSMFYRMRWVRLKELDEELAKFVKGVCEKHKMKPPRFGFIDDDNPQAFTYGSAAFNARVILTRGIFTYLNEEERKAVVAHELGHIHNRDFIIMSMANTILQLLYEFYVIFTRMERRGKEERKDVLFIIGVISYIFYMLGSYVLLYLSRLREYYADEFSSRQLDGNYLATALIKIAYGVIARPEDKRSSRLLRATRSMGILDFKAAKGVGMAYYQAKKLKDWNVLKRVFLYDLHSPWAFLLELSSTHPLTGKRVIKLLERSKHPIFDPKELKRFKIDRSKLYGNFLLDVLVNFSFLLFFPLFLISFYLSLGFLSLSHVFASIFLALGLSGLLKAFYRYPEGEFEKSDVLEQLRDVYASPVRGKPITLEGKIVGRGVPGLIFSEDMLFADETGLITLNYEGFLPLFSNLIFAFFKLDNLVGRKCELRGWFLRGMYARVELKEVKVEGERIQSYNKFWAVLGSLLFLLLGVTLAFVW